MPNLPRCRDCQARITFLGSPFTGRTRAFDAIPVDGRAGVPNAYPVMGARAWKVAELVEHLMVSREVSAGAAEDEARDMPWYVLHTCPNAPERTPA